MKGEWQRVTFEELYAIPSRNGLSKPSRIRGQGHPMINMGELFANDFIGNVKMERVPLTEEEMLSASVTIGDLLFARQSLVASGAGRCVYVSDVPELTVFESHLIRVRLDQKIADPKFYYYYFRSGCANVQSIVTHSVQAGIKASELAKLLVSLPPLPTQRRIAAVLGALDDKIELNRKMNANLEAQAQALFKSWFVDFAPWGGTMPTGWKKGTLGEIAEYSSSRISVDNVRCDYYSTDGMMTDRQGATASALPTTGNVVDVNIGDTLVSNIRPYFKKIFHATAKCTCSTDVLCFRPISPCWEYFLYRALWSDEFFAHAVAGAKGTKMPRGDKSQMMCFEIVKPNEDTLVDFNRLISPMCQQIASNVTQSAKLAELRDALLPKLMSGELEVA